MPSRARASSRAACNQAILAAMGGNDETLLAQRDRGVCCRALRYFPSQNTWLAPVHHATVSIEAGGYDGAAITMTEGASMISPYRPSGIDGQRH